MGVQAKGVLAMRLEISGTAAHGADPVARRERDPEGARRVPAIESLPFARESSDLFDRPSINLGRILGGDALNKVPDRCVIDVDIRYLPARTRPRSASRSRTCPTSSARISSPSRPAIVDRNNPYVPGVGETCQRARLAETISVGRDGASDAICFIDAGVPRSSSGPSEAATTALPNGSLQRRC